MTGGCASRKPSMTSHGDCTTAFGASSHTSATAANAAAGTGSAGALNELAFCAMNAVLTSARRNAGSRSARTSQDALVEIPSARTSSTPSMSRSSAASREVPWAMILPSRESYNAGTMSPASKP